MIKHVMFALAASLALSAAAQTAAPAAAPLAGSWAPASAEFGGAPFPLAAFKGAQLVLSDKTYAFAGDQGSYSLAPGGAPAAMDIKGESGPNAGKTIPAIYKLDGDRLDIAYQLGQGARPADFSSPTGTAVLVVHYKRAGASGG